MFLLIRVLSKYISIFIRTVLLSHTLCRRVGFYGVFSMAGTLYTVALLYGLFVLKEVPAKEKSEQQQQQLMNKSFLADFFDFAHIKETFMVAIKVRARNRRMKILALMAVIIIVVGPQHGTAIVKK